MRQMLVMIAVTVSLTGASLGAQSTYTFAGIPWGSSRTDVQNTLIEKGYTFDKEVGESDLMFRGSISNERAAVRAFFDPDGHLVKIGVFLITADEDAEPTYRSTIEQLHGKYGEPDLTLRRFDAPYEEGDGHEETAIKDGKGHVAACWAHGEKVTDDPQDALCASITSELTVSISYESVRWDPEADRRKAKAAKDL